MNRITAASYLCLFFFIFSFVLNSYTQESEVDSLVTGSNDSILFSSDIPYNPVPLAYEKFLVHDSLRKYYVVEDSAMYTFTMIQNDLFYFMNRYPEYVKRVWVGQSEFGIDMTAIRIGSGEPKENRILLVGNIHAREDYSSKLLMKFVNIYLLSIEGKSKLYPRAKELLDSIDIFILPVANPDGLKIAHQDFEGIESDLVEFLPYIKTIESLREWKANGKGIDLNKSFDDGNFFVKRGNDFQANPASEGYKGERPSEPEETKRIEELLWVINPLMTASFHTKGNILFWADKQTHAQFKDLDTEINKRVATASGFRLAGVSQDPSEYGCGLENYVRTRLGMMGTCIELSNGNLGRVQHPDEDFNYQVWSKAWEIPYIYIQSTVEFGSQIRANCLEYLTPQVLGPMEDK